jgi:hypothetical protein
LKDSARRIIDFQSRRKSPKQQYSKLLIKPATLIEDIWCERNFLLLSTLTLAPFPQSDGLTVVIEKIKSFVIGRPGNAPYPTIPIATAVTIGYAPCRHRQ